ncbi:MAG: Qat anti-phage system TatD family nuclease QatD [Pyrinomonadaceae bacterium]
MIDAHCHLDLYPKPTSVAVSANNSKVLTVMVTNLPSAFEKSLPFLKTLGYIRPALGLHPQLAQSHKAELNKFRELVNLTSYIGEIGLDFAPEFKDLMNVQIESFQFAIQCLGTIPKFVTIHSRRAETMVLKLLKELKYPFPVVFHWYSGSLTVLAQAVDDGHYFSINPAMIKSATGQKVISRIPKEQILTETDGPFVNIGNRVAVPSDVAIVERFLASQWSTSDLTARRLINENFMRILKPIRRLQQSIR